MHWIDWVIIVLFGLNALTVIGNVGQPRTPLRPGTAVAVTIINAAIITGVLLTHL